MNAKEAKRIRRATRLVLAREPERVPNVSYEPSRTGGAVLGKCATKLYKTLKQGHKARKATA